MSEEPGFVVVFAGKYPRDKSDKETYAEMQERFREGYVAFYENERERGH
jgi:hypothetical protein